MLVRFRWFRRILLDEKREWRDRRMFAAWLGTPLALGVAARLLLGYEAADLTLAGAFLAGLIAGPYAGALVGAAVGFPPLFAHPSEWASLPFAVGCGFAGGGLREICPKEEIWRFSPFVVTKLLRSAWRLIRNFTLDWQVILVLAPMLLEVLRQQIDHRFPLRIFDSTTPSGWINSLEIVTTVLCVAIPIKIWNSARIEHLLAEQEQHLMRARIDALAHQMNPHFLFNTLNSIKSLIRSRPDTAREVLDKLSGLMRRHLNSHENFVALGVELAAVNEYLDIERIRFGSALEIEQEIDQTSLGVVVPSMIIQPLVENCIKHGLFKKTGIGRITIRCTRRAGHVVIEVLDNGVGIIDDQLQNSEHHGIGLKNVNERLRVIYGANYRLRLHSMPELGTSARMEIPEIMVAERATA